MEKEQSTHKPEHEKNDVEVTVIYTSTGRKAAFSVEKNDTLQKMFDIAYAKLQEQKQSGDKYFCGNGASLTDDLDKKVQAIISSKCKEGTFEIRAPTGGA